MPRAAIDDLKEAFEQKGPAEREHAASLVTDLFVASAASFSDQHVALFDQVIGLLADAIEVRARAHLAERLADLPNAPPELVKKLARDEIMVARPMLARSPRLLDADLIEAARSGGRDHMLAISERRTLSPAVTDVLVTEGDRVVVHSVAGNPGATFSDAGFDVLISRSQTDELLQATLGRRADIPQRHMSILFDLAKKAAKARLVGELEGASRKVIDTAVTAGAKDVAAASAARAEATRKAIQEVSAAIQANTLTEDGLLDYARRHQADHAVVALAYLAKLPLALVERGVSAGDHDFVLVVARSIDLQWSTVKAMLLMKPEFRPSDPEIERFRDSYAKLNVPTAQRILQFMHARERSTRR